MDTDELGGVACHRIGKEARSREWPILFKRNVPRHFGCRVGFRKLSQLCVVSLWMSLLILYMYKYSLNYHSPPFLTY